MSNHGGHVFIQVYSKEKTSPEPVQRVQPQAANHSSTSESEFNISLSLHSSAMKLKA